MMVRVVRGRHRVLAGGGDGGRGHLLLSGDHVDAAVAAELPAVLVAVLVMLLQGVHVVVVASAGRRGRDAVLRLRRLLEEAGR